MSVDKKNGLAAVVWWIGWILLTIASFFVSCYFWTGFIAKNVGTLDKPGVSVLWVATVFGSWMIFLVPLIILMYSRVDRAYEDARIARETASLQKAKAASGIKSISVDPEKRTLSRDLSRKLKTFPETMKNAHLVTAVLRDGRKFENVFVINRREVMGIYDYDLLPFDITEIAGFEPADLDHPPDFKVEKWLRLDGA